MKPILAADSIEVEFEILRIGGEKLRRVACLYRRCFACRGTSGGRMVRFQLPVMLSYEDISYQ